MTLAAISPGFADQVGDSQHGFSAIMHAMAQPGLPFALTGPAVPPEPMTGEMTAVLLTLVDADTPVWLSLALRAVPSIARYIAFHCGAPLTDDPAQAAFAFAVDWSGFPPLAAFAQGTAEYPDRSTTLVVAGQVGAGSQQVSLSGPGIQGTRHLERLAMPPDRLLQWQQNHRRFPLGVDVIITSKGHVTGLPRTTRIEGGL